MTYLIKPDTSTAWRYVTWLITCLLRVCSALYCEPSAGLSRQAVSSGEAGCSCLPDGPSPTPLLLCRHEVHLVRAASWHHAYPTLLAQFPHNYTFVSLNPWFYLFLWPVTTVYVYSLSKASWPISTIRNYQLVWYSAITYIYITHPYLQDTANKVVYCKLYSEVDCKSHQVVLEPVWLFLALHIQNFPLHSITQLWLFACHRSVTVTCHSIHCHYQGIQATLLIHLSAIILHNTIAREGPRQNQRECLDPEQ